MTDEKLHEHAQYAVQAGKGKHISEIPELLAKRGLQPYEIDEVMRLLNLDNALRNVFYSRQYMLYSGLAVLVLVLYNVLMYRLMEKSGEPWWKIVLTTGKTPMMMFCYSLALSAFIYTVILYLKRKRFLSNLEK